MVQWRFYGRTLRGRRPQALTMIPEENWPGRSDRGARLVDGRFRFLNHTVSAEDLAAGKSDTGPSWQAEYHSFDWLRDMRAVGTEAARVQGAYLYDGMDGREPEMASRQLAAGCTGTARL